MCVRWFSVRVRSVLVDTFLGEGLFRVMHTFITFGNIELYPLISVANLL